VNIVPEQGFFEAAASVAGTLIGLLFVALSMGREREPARPGELQHIERDRRHVCRAQGHPTLAHLRPPGMRRRCRRTDPARRHRLQL
jgi:hypothetical protein